MLPLKGMIEKKDIMSYINLQCFKENTDIHCHNPYRRPIFTSNDDIEQLLNTEFINPSSLSASAYLANRILFNIYEQDMLFLPKNDYKGFYEDFKNFYSEKATTLAHKISPGIEHAIFKGFRNNINITGKWKKDDVFAYLKDTQKHINQQKTNDLVNAIKQSKNPLRAFKIFLIQGASDLLAEAAGAARGIMGSYGSVQSELFTILIDEYGYGVHESKHSTIYEKLMSYYELNNSVHYYWNFYTNSFLFLHNYVHFIYKHPKNFFKQIGSLFYAETAYARACHIISDMIRELWGEESERTYYDEHAHIDAYHQKMALERVILPLLEKYDTPAISDIVLGAEEFNFIQGMCSQELIRHISFLDSLDDYKNNHDQESFPTAFKDSSKKYETGKIYTPAFYEKKSHYFVHSGKIKIFMIDNSSITLEEKQHLKIPEGIVHALTSEATTSHVDVTCGENI